MSEKNRRSKWHSAGIVILAISVLISSICIILYVCKKVFNEELSNSSMISEANNIKAIIENPAENSGFYMIDLSAYNSEPNQTDSTPWITASGKECKPGVLALSRDLLNDYTEGAPFTFGDKVLCIKIYGVFEVEDTMHKRKKMRGDVWKMERKEAYKFGIHRGVVIVKVN